MLLRIMKEAEELLEKYKAGLCTAEELQLLQKWFHHLGEDEVSELSSEHLISARLQFEKNIRGSILPVRSYKLWPRIAAVAAAVAAVTLGVRLFVSEIASSRKASRNDDLVSNDIAPGKNTATLTLPDGKTIHLSDAKSGVIIDDTSLKYNDGSAIESSLREGTRETSSGQAKQSQQDSQDEIASSLRLPRNDGEAVMLTASTPRGGTYQVVLPDGSKVWLNADSKISFPSHFFGAERKIILAGEAYFEVSHNKSKPFVVQTDKQEVTVLGTHFNINSYADEGSTKTTLLEGSVSVSSLLSSRAIAKDLGPTGLGTTNVRGPSKLGMKGSLGAAAILKPGQQSVLTGGNQIKVNQVDASLVVAWKEGQFSFQNEALESIMRKVGRWYDVDVVYEDENLRKAIIWGKVSRFENISKVLSKLQLTGQAKFKVEGRSVYVFN